MKIYLKIIFFSLLFCSLLISCDKEDKFAGFVAYWRQPFIDSCWADSAVYFNFYIDGVELSGDNQLMCVCSDSHPCGDCTTNEYPAQAPCYPKLNINIKNDKSKTVQVKYECYGGSPDY